MGVCIPISLLLYSLWVDHRLAVSGIVDAFNQEEALVWSFSVIVKLPNFVKVRFPLYLLPAGRIVRGRQRAQHHARPGRWRAARR